MPHLSGVGVEPKLSNAHMSTTYVSVDNTVKQVTAECLGATTDEMVVDGVRYIWPAGGQISVYMSNLPEDYDDIVVAIRDHLETVDEDGYVLFPVKSIEVSPKVGLVQVIGDVDRIYRMRPMPS